MALAERPRFPGHRFRGSGVKGAATAKVWRFWNGEAASLKTEEESEWV
jgi:hypothetical protein